MYMNSFCIKKHFKNNVDYYMQVSNCQVVTPLVYILYFIYLCCIFYYIIDSICSLIVDIVYGVRTCYHWVHGWLLYRRCCSPCTCRYLQDITLIILDRFYASIRLSYHIIFVEAFNIEYELYSVCFFFCHLLSYL